MQNHLFLRTSPLKLFFLAAIPGAISMLSSSLYQLIDGILVGRFLGETAFAALNLAMPFVIVNFALADLVGVGSAVPISISLGQKQEKEANNIFSCACLMIVLTGILMGAILFAAAPWLMALMGAQGEFAEFAVSYLRVYALCSPVTTIVFAMDNYLRICGKIRYSMALNIIMSVLSAVLEFLFLYVFGWGIWAAALATCSGMCICAVLALIPFFLRKTQLRYIRPRFHAKMFRQILSCGAPTFLSNIAGRIASILMNMLLVRMGGETAVSVYGILMYVDGFIQPLIYGACDSLQPAVGYNWGAGQYSRVRAIERCCFIASAVISLVSALVIFLIPETICSLFLAPSETDSLSLAVSALYLFDLTYLTRWFSFAMQSYMLAVGKPAPASLLSISVALVFPVLLMAVLYPLGLTGLWLNLPIASLLTGLLAVGVFLKLRSQFYRQDEPIT